jgi:hypothetical protein
VSSQVQLGRSMVEHPVLPFPLKLKTGTYSSQLMLGHPLPGGKWIYCFIKRSPIKLEKTTICLKKNQPTPFGTLISLRHISGDCQGGRVGKPGRSGLSHVNSSRALMSLPAGGAVASRPWTSFWLCARLTLRFWAYADQAGSWSS